MELQATDHFAGHAVFLRIVCGTVPLSQSDPVVPGSTEGDLNRGFTWGGETAGVIEDAEVQSVHGVLTHEKGPAQHDGVERGLVCESSRHPQADHHQRGDEPPLSIAPGNDAVQIPTTQESPKGGVAVGSRNHVICVDPLPVFQHDPHGPIDGAVVGCDYFSRTAPHAQNTAVFLEMFGESPHYTHRALGQ